MTDRDDRTGHWIALSRARFGWWAEVTDYGDGDIIGVGPPAMWRPTRQGALRRAMRYCERHTGTPVEEFPADAIQTVWIAK